MNDNEDYVFAVDKWETLDGLHHVTVKINGELITVKFEEWGKAEKWANYTARVMGLKKYQVDTPDRPHTWISVKEKEGKLKLDNEKVTPFETLCTIGMFLSIAVLGLTMIYEKRLDGISFFSVMFFWCIPYVIRWLNKK